MKIMGNGGKRNGESSDRWVVFDNGQGPEVGKLLRAAQNVAVFEMYNPTAVLQVSEVFQDFQILMKSRTVYAGRAVVHHLINTGLGIVCEVSLDDTWVNGGLVELVPETESVQAGFVDFLEAWRRTYRVLPEYKVVMTDLQSFMLDLRNWVEQVDLSLSGRSGSELDACHREMVARLSGPVGRALDTMVERFEGIVEGLTDEARPAHKVFLQRQLHPLILCSPFAHRAYSKPLGYAGDYRMVSMIAGDPCEGPSLFAKLINVWFLGQPPAQAHRNRLEVLMRHLRSESIRVSRWGRPARFYSLGCGPAFEVQRFLGEARMGHEPEFTLVDFNEETLEYAGSALSKVQRQHGRRASIRLLKKSVIQLLKEAARTNGERSGEEYDVVYCAGLFDYLTDEVCRRLMTVLYQMVAPGGLLLVTNVDASLNASKGFRHSMEYMLDWNLVFRGGRELEALATELGPGLRVAAVSDVTGVNNFLEVRKPCEE
jgi:extracellular factor (EF) 3-hydroxypalmitic acid methyl ester biosynthesis protein